MQQVHRFVCSVATGVEEATPATCGGNRQGVGPACVGAASQRRHTPPPGVGHWAWVTLQNFPHLFLGEVSLQGAVPLAGLRERSVRLPCGVAGTLAYPDVFESVLEASGEF
jgi:hypothetical protein